MARPPNQSTQTGATKGADLFAQPQGKSDETAAAPPCCPHRHKSGARCALTPEHMLSDDPLDVEHTAQTGERWTSEEEATWEREATRPAQHPVASAKPAQTSQQPAQTQPARTASAPATVSQVAQQQRPAQAPAARPAPTAPAQRMALPGQRPKATEVKEKPYRFFLIGEPGIGKSTFGVQADEPIFMPAETSPNVPDDICFQRPDSWDDALTALRVLYASEHNYKTLIIDTLDALMTLCTAAVLLKAPTGSGTKGAANFLSDVGGGYGNAGSQALDEECTRFLAALDRLIERRGMNVIILGHSKLGKYKNPEAGGGDFDMWIPNVNELIANRVRGWADIVGLAKKDIYTGKDGGGKKGRTKATGIGDVHSLYLKSTPTAPWIKNRFELPARMPLDFETFSGYMHARRTPAETESMIAILREKAERLAGHCFLDRLGQQVEYSAWVTERLKRPATVGELVQLDSKLQSKISELFPPVDDDEDKPAEASL